MRIGRSWLSGLAALVLPAVALGVMHVRGTAPAQAGPAIPAWLPAMAAPEPTPEPAPLGVDWLATHPAPDLGIHAGGAVLLDLDTREVLWAREPHDARPLVAPPASQPRDDLRMEPG